VTIFGLEVPDLLDGDDVVACAHERIG